MKSIAARVRQFHSAVGDSDPPIPTQPDTALLSLRRALIEEESRDVLEAFTHLREAVSERDREVRFSELVHEPVDMLYVTYGALAAFGVEADEAFREVHRANMEKVERP